MRKRISVTIREDLLRQLDATVGSGSITNRSRAIESLLEERFTQPSADVFLLVGDPFSTKRVGGKLLLNHVLTLLKSQNFLRILIGVTSDILGDLKKEFGNGEALGLSISYLEQKEKIGTAATLRKAKNRFSNTFLLIYGDNLFNFDLRELLAFHRQTGAFVTAALTTVNSPSSFGVVELQGKLITSFNEKPAQAESHLVSTGVFVIDPRSFPFIPEKARSLENEVFPKLVEEGKLAGCVLSGRWAPIQSEADVDSIGEEFLRAKER
jgi:NDP-sugar pyrophosphorylase family protein